TIPAAAISRRIGLRGMLFIALTGGALAMLLRASSVSEATLTATAFLHGLFLAFWAVSDSPVIAGLTMERNRQFAFGLVSATAISLGVISSLVGGQLPGLLRSLVHSLGPVEAHRWSLMVSAGLILFAAIPLRPVRFPRIAASETRLYPRGRFLPCFLLALAVWGAATGGFNPFFNAFFSQRLRMSTEGIGTVSAFSHLFQAVVILLSPLVLKRLGAVKGIAWMQLATALALAAVAASPASGAAATAYVAYMSFQYMSEPGIFSMLMNRVNPGERSGASALYFLVSSLVGSAAALASGAAIARFGYPPVLLVCATVAALSAVMFRALIRDTA
ncbi:MAG TPA: MFS transporter, partial [Bryobacteraceae bacterium]